MMTNQKEKADSFFIGWQEKAPIDYSNATKKFVLTIAIITIAVAGILVLGQKGFVNSVFELGQLTTVEGTLVVEPAPMIQIMEDGRKKSILLVGFGKMGPEMTIEKIKESTGTPIVGESIKLEGTLIYHEGKTVMELTKGVGSFKGLGGADVFTNDDSFEKDFGEVSLKGEILDPKCALGVMKPGYGKPHRSCAVRCISGGITPIFRITNREGKSNYCLLKGSDGGAINELVLPYVADQIRICGRLKQQDDWLVFYLDPQKELLRLQPYWVEGEVPMCSKDSLGSL